MEGLAVSTSLLQDLQNWLAFDQALLLQPDMLARLLVEMLLLVGSAYFSGSETALFSLSRLDLQRLSKEDHPQAANLLRLLEQPRRLIISILCGNEIINVAAAANMAVILVGLYGPGKAELINILIMVPLLLLFGEVTPKTIAVSNPVRISAEIVVPPMTLWVRLITPLRELIRLLADRITTWIVGEQKAPENLLRIDELTELLEEALEEGGITPVSSTLVHNLLEAGATDVEQIMTPRTETRFIEAGMPVAEAMERIRQYRYNRLPVYQGDHDNFLGFLRAEDFIPFATGVRSLDEVSLEQLIHPPVVVPPSKKIDEMFDYFQDHEEQAAMVLDEFGGIAGMITMKAVLRFIFNQVALPAPGQHLYREQDMDHYLLPGDMRLADFNRLTHFGLKDPRMSTIGGLLLRHLNRLPATGDSITVEDIQLTVRAMEGRRIAQVEAVRGRGSRKVNEDTGDAGK